MSDTPISDSTSHNIADLGMLCRRLERELTAANERIKRLKEDLMDARNQYAVLVADVVLYEDRGERIKRLEEALGCVVVDCNHLHHRKKHQHKLGEPCPVEELIRKAKEAKP
jgi:hypothetical protein